MASRNFLMCALWAALFAAGSALAQEAAISGADFTGGKADAQLKAIGSQAAASGRTVVITAPAYWQEKAAAKVRAGAHGKPVTIRFSNGFYENVLVRSEVPASKPEAQAKSPARPEAKVAAQPRPKASAKPGPKVKAEPAPTPAPLAAVPQPAPHAAAPVALPPPVRQPAVQTAPPPGAIVAVPQLSHQPEVVPIPTSAPTATGVRPAMPVQSSENARARLLASLNDGRPAAGELQEAQLQSGDQVYSDGDTLAVVRLEGLRRSLYWLTGPVDLQRVQYSPQGRDQYQVTGPIDPKAPPAHRSAPGHHVVAARVPPAQDPARARMERQYNNGRAISNRLQVAQLQSGDRLLVDGTTVLAVRREGNLLTRYWLDGSIDLGQTGVQKVDANLYQVTGVVH